MKNIITILILLFASNIYSQQSNQFVFLFDNSGSMTGYYEQPNSLFKLFSKSLIRNSIKPGDEVDIMLFSKTEKDRGMESPKVLYEGSTENLLLERVMQEFKIIRARDGDKGRTDLIETLDKGISVIEEDVGIIWLVTDLSLIHI